jgi:hypothetical protein
MLPPSSRLKCVGSEIGFVIQGSCKMGGHKTQGEGVKEIDRLIVIPNGVFFATEMNVKFL